MAPGIRAVVGDRVDAVQRGDAAGWDVYVGVRSAIDGQCAHVPRVDVTAQRSGFVAERPGPIFAKWNRNGCCRAADTLRAHGTYDTDGDRQDDNQRGDGKGKTAEIRPSPSEKVIS